MIEAVDAFAHKMKAKLVKKARQGYRGWETASPAHLTRLLFQHLEKGDPVDVANFCMMLEKTGHGPKMTFALYPIELAKLPISKKPSPRPEVTPR